MEYRYLLYSFLCALGAFLYYKFHKWWLNGTKKKEQVVKDEMRHSKIIKNWMIIVMFSLAAIIFLIKSI